LRNCMVKHYREPSSLSISFSTDQSFFCPSATRTLQWYSEAISNTGSPINIWTV
jgi:hypothetical protein